MSSLNRVETRFTFLVFRKKVLLAFSNYVNYVNRHTVNNVTLKQKNNKKSSK